MTGPLERTRAHHDVAPGARQPVQQDDGRSPPPPPRPQASTPARSTVARVAMRSTLEHGHRRDRGHLRGRRPRALQDHARGRGLLGRWCGPCRQLTPILEREAGQARGQGRARQARHRRQPTISQAFGIQGIPAVKAFKNGRVVDEFVGAQPPAQVERFFDGLVPSEADGLVAGGRRGVAAPRAGARAGTRRGRRPAGPPPARPRRGRRGAEAGRAHRRRLRRRGARRADPARAGRGRRLQEAFAALDAGETERGLDMLLEALAGSADGTRDDVRRAIVGVLDELGADDPRAREYRRRLAAALY